MSIRLATREDVDGIFLVETETFSVPWSKESIAHDLEDTERTLYLIMEDEEEQIIGYAGAWLVADEGQITNIAIRPQFRREGYGGVLVRSLLKEIWKRGMTEIFLEVRISNIAALTLYRRLGFTVKGIRKNYYSDPQEDAYIMSLIKDDEI